MVYQRPILTLIIVGFCTTHSTLAQPTASSLAPVDGSMTQVSFTPPPQDGQPDKTIGLGSRGESCPQDRTAVTLDNSPLDTPSLIALVPDNNYGLTLAEKPSFFIYVPNTSAKQVVLSIIEADNQHHSQTFLPIEHAQHVIRIQPSDDSPPLEVGKTYRWSVILVCHERPSPNDPHIVSWVHRMAPMSSLPQSIVSMKPLEQATMYGAQGIWYDTLESLAQAIQTQPNNLEMTAIWTNFLQSVGLTQISTEPLGF